MSVGGSHACGLTAQGQAWCWGKSEFGELGNAKFGGSESLPVLAAEGRSWTVLRAGGDTTCAIAENGALFCWGRNTMGQIGNGTTDHVATPNRVCFDAAN